MEPNLPATRDDVSSSEAAERPLTGGRPLSVAYLPLALVTFVVLAFIIAAWTFLATAA